MKHYNVAITYKITNDIMVSTDDETKVIDLAVEELYKRTPNKADVFVTKAEITQSWGEKELLTVSSSGSTSPYKDFLRCIDENAKSELVAEYLKDIIAPLYRYMYSGYQKELLSAKMFVDAMIDDTIKEDTENGV